MGGGGGVKFQIVTILSYKVFWTQERLPDVFSLERLVDFFKVSVIDGL